MTSRAEPKHPLSEGVSGIWTFVFIDMIVFFLMFLVYVSERARLHTLFIASQQQLHPLIGLLSTVFLLASSWSMAEAVAAARKGLRHATQSYLLISLLLAFGFVINKLVEYHDKFDHGITPTTNGFFTFYFVITGLHFAHVLAGMLFIGQAYVSIGRIGDVQSAHRHIENIGTFWHFVDILWLFIFPMLYLAGIR